MMRNRWSTWVNSIRAGVLTGGVLLASAGLGLTVAALLWFVAPAGAIPLESWDDKIPNATLRFRVLPEFGGAAVLDRETQLVWEQAPFISTQGWFSSLFQCANRTTGGRKGWRLPSVHELASLIDPNAASAPFLPSGHPFTNIQSAGYWSASTIADLPTNAWLVFFQSGVENGTNKSTDFHAWCVRGGNNADAY